MFFHDAMPIVWLIRPELFDVRPCTISVDCSGEFTRGMTIVDTLRRNTGAFAHKMAWDADVGSVLKMVIEDLGSFYGGMS